MAIDAGSVHYYVENIEKLDMIAERLDVGKIGKVFSRVFDYSTPWDDKWQEVILGSDTHVSDSYPVYYFPFAAIPSSTRDMYEGKDFPKPAYANAGAYPLGGGFARLPAHYQTFVSQTFFYIVESMIHGAPYHCSSLRSPVALEITRQVNSVVDDFIANFTQLLSDSQREKIAEIQTIFRNVKFSQVLSPILRIVLDTSKSPEDIISAVFSLRTAKETEDFRKWTRVVNIAARQGDIEGLFQAKRELDQIANITKGTQSRLDVISLNRGIEIAVNNKQPSYEQLSENISKPHLVFMRQVALSCQNMLDNRTLIKSVLKADFDNQTISELENLRNLTPNNEDEKQDTVKYYIYGNVAQIVDRNFGKVSLELDTRNELELFQTLINWINSFLVFYHSTIDLQDKSRIKVLSLKMCDEIANLYKKIRQDGKKEKIELGNETIRSIFKKALESINLLLVDIEDEMLHLNTDSKIWTDKDKWSWQVNEGERALFKQKTLDWIKKSEVTKLITLSNTVDFQKIREEILYVIGHSIV